MGVASGELMLGEQVLVKLGQGTIARDLSRACGFWGGGWPSETDA